ncbi:AbrB/MazE/SpoVT family DNA-binding domain-containing protein [Halanaerobium hydrogeniformans]|uniref:Transcriptional regulator, AbrB family n=1 Tax=Halanaerobium hydrogeniformans TaxID=656519 RepID=E4RKY9_HALHG|nr:AbrB/MazE/SpoVT family DNA-binding domain-containing protein [Halanaerobium hydrogeniformans]ADQ15730.1 transcriptional regulator, AbrB family [Halanaerobium hydrogeniformans]
MLSKTIGIVRKIDNLGRVVIPKELRKAKNINSGDPMEIFIEGDKIILRKYEPACIFCGSADDNFEYEGKSVCKECIKGTVQPPKYGKYVC